MEVVGWTAISVEVVAAGTNSVVVVFGSKATVSVRYSVKAEGHEYMVSVVTAEGRCAKVREAKIGTTLIEGFMAPALKKRQWTQRQGGSQQ